MLTKKGCQSYARFSLFKIESRSYGEMSDGLSQYMALQNLWRTTFGNLLRIIDKDYCSKCVSTGYCHGSELH